MSLIVEWLLFANAALEKRHLNGYSLEFSSLKVRKRGSGEGQVFILQAQSAQREGSRIRL